MTQKGSNLIFYVLNNKNLKLCSRYMFYRNIRLGELLFLVSILSNIYFFLSLFHEICCYFPINYKIKKIHFFFVVVAPIKKKIILFFIAMDAIAVLSSMRNIKMFCNIKKVSAEICTTYI